MKCLHCGREMEQGIVESKSISASGLSYTIVTYSTKKLVNKKRIRLKEKEYGYYCKYCDIVLCEYHMNRGNN